MEILPRIMIKVLKDLLLTIAYLDDIIIYSNTAEEHLDHLQQVFHKLCNAELSMKMREVPILCQGNSLFGPCPQHYWYKVTTFQNSSN